MEKRGKKTKGHGKKKIPASFPLFMGIHEIFSVSRGFTIFWCSWAISDSRPLSAVTAFQKIGFREGIFDSIKSTHRGNRFVHLLSTLHTLKGRQFFSLKSYFFRLISASPVVNISTNSWSILCRHCIRASCGTLGAQSLCGALGRSRGAADVQSRNLHNAQKTEFRPAQLCSHSQGRYSCNTQKYQHCSPVTKGFWGTDGFWMWGSRWEWEWNRRGTFLQFFCSFTH